jgi:putative addiction module CopG family antidote
MPIAVPLPEELQRFIDDELAAGRYRSADAMIIEALRFLQERDRKLAGLRAEIDAAVTQAATGDVISISSEAEHRAYFENLKARAAERS